MFHSFIFFAMQVLSTGGAEGFKFLEQFACSREDGGKYVTRTFHGAVESCSIGRIGNFMVFDSKSAGLTLCVNQCILLTFPFAHAGLLTSRI
jgi:hypothetical protein